MSPCLSACAPQATLPVHRDRDVHSAHALHACWMQAEGMCGPQQLASPTASGSLRACCRSLATRGWRAMRSRNGRPGALIQPEPAREYTCTMPMT